MENICFDELQPGTYKVFVDYFNEGGDFHQARVPCTVTLQSQFRIQVSGPDMSMTTVSGVKEFSKQLSLHDYKHIFSFTVNDANEGLSEKTAEELCRELRETRNMSMAIIDCSHQSKWNRGSEKWCSFKKNIQECMDALGEGKTNDSFHFEAGNEQEILEKFKEIARRMEPFGSAARPRKKSSETNVVSEMCADPRKREMPDEPEGEQQKAKRKKKTRG